MVKKGGVIVFSTCSLLPQEGADLIESLLVEDKTLSRSPITAEELGLMPDLVTEEGDLRTLPFHYSNLGGMDGFYAVRLIRNWLTIWYYFATRLTLTENSALGAKKLLAYDKEAIPSYGILDRLWQSAFGTVLYDYTLKRRVPKKTGNFLVTAFPGDAVSGYRFLAGSVIFDGKKYSRDSLLKGSSSIPLNVLNYFDSFGWLSDLCAVKDDKSKSLAISFIIDWIIRNQSWRKKADPCSADCARECHQLSFPAGHTSYRQCCSRPFDW